MTQASIVSVEIRRDALTITPTTVFEHELSILYGLYGKENITVGMPIGERAIDVEHEYMRLVNKYDEGVIARIFGVADSPALANAIKPVSRPKPAAKSAALAKE